MKQTITIGWLYPELMNIYGDRGNVIALKKRLEWRGIETNVLELNVDYSKEKLKECDLLIIGGAQDKQQEAVIKDLWQKKDLLKEKIEKNTPGLFICGAYQMLGNYYKTANGNVIKGLGIFNLYTQNPGLNNKRLIGNVVVSSGVLKDKLIGFENHGGRTYLGKNVMPLGKVLKGYGNNGQDQTEGVIYKNSIGTYLHGPILPKNPALTDYLITKAIENKYKITMKLDRLDDEIEKNARIAIAKRLSIAI